MTDMELQKKAMEVKSSGGSLDDLTAQFTSASPDSIEFKKQKEQIGQKLSALRTALKKKCEAEGIPVERVSLVIPNFRTGRKSSKASELNELFESIMSEE